jgi:hypothetical protein
MQSHYKKVRIFNLPPKKFYWFDNVKHYSLLDLLDSSGGASIHISLITPLRKKTKIAPISFSVAGCSVEARAINPLSNNKNIWIQAR